MALNDLTLRAGAWQATVRPEVGGALASLTFDGAEVLRTMPEGSANPLDAACFPLVPYCNRIRDGRFSWDGRTVQMPANFPPEPHSLHGLGWQAPWTVTAEAGFKCSLSHSYDGSGAWPWAYEAEQRVRLGSQGCAITLHVTNRGDTAMPCGLGLHPYFRRRPETRVRFSATGMLEVRFGPTKNSMVSSRRLSGAVAMASRTIVVVASNAESTPSQVSGIGGTRPGHSQRPVRALAMLLWPFENTNASSLTECMFGIGRASP